MIFLRRLSIQSKLILILVFVSMVAVMAVSYASYQTARAAAEDAAQRQLMGVRTTKTHLLQMLLGNYRDQLTSFATSRTALESLTAFTQAIHQLDAKPPDAASQAKLDAFYKDTFIPALAKAANVRAELPRLLPAEPGGRLLQSLYIAANPHPYEQGFKLAVADDGSQYAAAHKRFHDIYTQITRRTGLEDLMLVDGASLRIVYTFQKTVEFGTNLARGPYANTNLAATVKQLLKAGDRSAFSLADFELYRPNLGKPSAFLCAPVFDGPTPAGVVVFQLPMDRIIQIMTANYSWAQEGLGKTGEVYMVGQDKLMRSRSRFMIEDQKAALASLRSAGLPEAVMSQIERQKTVLLALPVDNASTHKALAGQSGVHEVTDYRNQLVVSAYGPMDFGNVRWAVLAEMDAVEAYGPVAALGRRNAATAAGLAILISLLALAAATVVTKPIRALTAAARRVTAGQLDVQVNVETEDEIRELADAFNRMTLALKQKTGQLEQMLQRNEELLLNVLPASAAARLRDGSGEDNQPQTFADVSILYATINGLEDAPEGERQSLAWLHHLVVAFDEAAERHHIEKLKTMGPNYLAVCGLSLPRPDHHQRVVEFAEELLRIVAMFGQEKNVPLEIDIGINAGPVTGGVIGRKKFIYDLWGETVNLARMLKADRVSSIQVTEAVATRLQGLYSFERQEPGIERKSGPPIVYYRLTRHAESAAAAR